MKVKVISLMILAFLFLGMASAAENVDYSNETKNITFEGVNFTIPVGFGESKGNEDFNDLGSNGQTCFYVNEFNGEIIITVISDWMGMSLNELYKDGAIKSKVNGHEGWNYTEDDLHYFGYVHDDKGILIGVTNETRLYEIIL
ncbi:hypothetical protein [uncultured Methanobrevibacter sp.]|uniref:hypothetical protein n=1 Tax=uncultured Methanobrevibacter sp. TaxID=253161 RepID=UPI0025F9B829|nr:hypothetical protein [uncultured Methanobrevibacter sp.]